MIKPPPLTFISVPLELESRHHHRLTHSNACFKQRSSRNEIARRLLASEFRYQARDIIKRVLLGTRLSSLILIRVRLWRIARSYTIDIRGIGARRRLARIGALVKARAATINRTARPRLFRVNRLTRRNFIKRARAPLITQRRKCVWPVNK